MAFPCLPFPLALFGRKITKPGETSELTWSISSLTNEETKAQTSVRFATWDHRAADSEPWHARGSKSTFLKEMNTALG